MKKTIVALIFGMFLVGAFVGYWLHYCSSASIRSNWIELQNAPLSGDDSCLGYSTEVIFESDIPGPEIERIDVKIKFIESTEQQEKKKAHVGYIVEVSVENLDVNNIPEKYKKEHKMAGDLVIPPLEQATYEAKLSFKLFDKDSFVLLELTGEQTHHLVTGKTNIFQGLTKEMVPVSIIRRIAKFKPYLHVTKCLSSR